MKKKKKSKFICPVCREKGREVAKNNRIKRTCSPKCERIYQSIYVIGWRAGRKEKV